MTAETKHNPAEQVGIGCLVELELINREGDGERMTVTLVREQAANMEQSGGTWCKAQSCDRFRQS